MVICGLCYVDLLLLNMNFLLTFQGELFKIIHSSLVSVESREKTLEYIAEVLSRNHKRSHIQVDLLSLNGPFPF